MGHIYHCGGLDFLYNVFMKKIIGLVDCDSFFASCEQAANPDLRDAPVCVMSRVDDTGIVLARSKSVKQMGIKMCAPYFQIKNKFPGVIFIPAHMDLYQEMSRRVMKALSNFSPNVEVASIDEAYIDLTGTDAVAICSDIRETIYSELKINVSIGISASKLLAKLASDYAKETNGIFEIKSDKILETIGDLEIGRVSGIGRGRLAKMQSHKIFTIQDFLHTDDVRIESLFGITGLRLKYELMGTNISDVDSNPTPPKSIQSSHRLNDFTNDVAVIQNELNHHLQSVCRTLRKWNGRAEYIGVMLKYKNFQSVYKSEKLKMPTDSMTQILPIVNNLFNQLYTPNAIYRSCGVMIDKIDYKAPAPDLFSDKSSAPDKLGSAIDSLEQKFGKDIIKYGFV